MNLTEEHNNKYIFFKDITGAAMKVHSKFHSGLLESAYEAALKYLLNNQGYNVKKPSISTNLLGRCETRPNVPYGSCRQ